MGTSEEDSDYAYIDRSTHSITGYLQSPSNTNLKKSMVSKESSNFDSSNTKHKRFRKGNVTDQTNTINLLLANSFEPSCVDTDNPIEESDIVDKMCSTTSFIDSPSPYATIQVLRKHRQQKKDNLSKEQLPGNPLVGQHNLIHQRPHPGGFHTLKVKVYFTYIS